MSGLRTCGRIRFQTIRCPGSSRNHTSRIAVRKHTGFGPSQRRCQSSVSGVTGPRYWSQGRVLVLTAVAALGGYAFGAIDVFARGNEMLSRHHESLAYANESEMLKAISELKRAIGEDKVTTDADELHRHGFSEWSSTNSDTLPVAVAFPRSTADVSEIARICSRYRVPMSPFSGGTSLEGNFSAPFGGLSVDFAFMDQILEIHADDMDVVVQPSVPWMTLNEQLRDEGLFFPVDPGPTAQIGGMVGTGCSGTNAVRYGTMRDWVINLTVVLPDGTVIKTRRRPRKSAAGYNLNNLFVGSEGTLGFVTEATLKLAIVPQETSVAVVTFPTIRDAATAAGKIMRAGVPVAAMEIMDEVQMRVINESAATAKRWEEVPTMFFKFSGTMAGVHDNISNVKRIATNCNCGNFEFATSATEQEALWSARKNSLWSMLAMRKDDGAEVWGTDVAVPFSKLPELIDITKRDIDKLGLFASCLGHIGDGNFHASILYNKKDPAQRSAVEKCVHDMIDRALELEGTCTGEHGIGIGKKDALLKELGPDTVNVMKTIKRAIDPNLIMNPGKIMDC